MKIVQIYQNVPLDGCFALLHRLLVILRAKFVQMSTKDILMVLNFNSLYRQERNLFNNLEFYKQIFLVSVLKHFFTIFNLYQ